MQDLEGIFEELRLKRARPTRTERKVFATLYATPWTIVDNDSLYLAAFERTPATPSDYLALKGVISGLRGKLDKAGLSNKYRIHTKFGAGYAMITDDPDLKQRIAATPLPKAKDENTLWRILTLNEVYLPPVERRMLLTLLDSYENEVPKERLTQSLNGKKPMKPATLRVHVNKINSAFGETPINGAVYCVKSVYGGGYFITTAERRAA